MASATIYIQIFLFYIISNYYIEQIYGRIAYSELETTLGKIIGTNFTTRNGRNINAFLGIPYAQPPVGNLRFKNPLAALPWGGILIADEIAPPCPQINDNGEFVGVENCLFLNVYTPRINMENLLPTMIYIHGGAFQRGNAQPSYLGPDFLLDKDIVLVTLQYRLNILGFISTGDAVAPGNFGLKDQRVALQWVQDNIATFGGDPNNVTLFGQSAGGVSVNFHVLSPSGKDLFHRYIVQSGSALCPWAFSESEGYKKYAFEVGKNFNCSTDSSESLINCLRNVNVYELITSNNVFTGMQQLSGVTWVPTDEPDIAGAFLTEPPIKTILQNGVLDLPNISGVVKNEGLVVTSKLYANETLYNLFVGDINQFLGILTSSFAPSDDIDEVAESIKKFYFSNIDMENKTQVLMKLTDLIGDITFVFPQVLQLQFLNPRIESPCYLYSFEYRGKYSKTSLILKNDMNIGITHADDLIYLYPSTPDLFSTSTAVKLSESDYRMIDIITDMWTNFATLGVPITNFADDPYIWEPYTDDNIYLQISGNVENNITLTKQSDLLNNRMHFWMTLLINIFLR